MRAAQLSVPELSPLVKILIIANVGIYFVIQILFEKIIGVPVSQWFALFPGQVISSFTIWQLVTYMFLHSLSSPFHLLFNMIMLWFTGTPLEQRWGSKTFLGFYFFTGVGAALIYCLGIALYSSITGNAQPLSVPVVGASGAIYGLLLAFGILMGERIIQVFFVFSMKAKYFIMIIGLFELASLATQGFSGSGVANLAHLGGLATGFLGLFVMKWYNNNNSGGKGSSRNRGNLKLVVNNDKNPKYWN